MAYNQNQWDKAKGYYEAGLSLSQIKDKTNIARNTISQKAKKEQWEHGKNIDYIEAKEIIAVKKGTEKEQSIICADEVADNNIRRKNLVYGASEKLLQRTQQMIEDNKTFEKVNIGDGVQQFEPRELNSSDYKNLADTIDRSSITLGVNDRFSQSSVQVNQALMQNDSKAITKVEIIEDVKHD